MFRQFAAKVSYNLYKPLDNKRRINGHLFELFIPEHRINTRITEMAGQFGRTMKRGTTMVPVMSGAFYFAGQFLDKIDQSYRLLSVQASSYQGVDQSDELLISFLKKNHWIEGANLVILEDIVDTGRTANELEKYFYDRGANHVEVVALFFKPDKLQYTCNLTHYGFEVGTEFLVGYGLDVDEEGRYLKDVWRLVEE